MGQPTPPADPATPDPGATPPAQPPEPATGDGLGEAGRKALAEERAARKELEKQLKELQGRDPVKAIAEALGLSQQQQAAKGGITVETLAAEVTQLRTDLTGERLGRARLEVAAAKGLTPAQASRLQGSTREELDADADRLKELFPTSATPGTPAPDPTQGSRGTANALEAQLKAAQDKGDTREAIRLKQVLAEQRKPK